MCVTPFASAPRQASDSVLSLLQDAAAIGLSRYPERLGQLFVVNVPAADRACGGGGGGGLMLAARTLGLGAALDAGKLRVLPGELPKWAPELLKVGETRRFVFFRVTFCCYWMLLSSLFS